MKLNLLQFSQFLIFLPGIEFRGEIWYNYVMVEKWVSNIKQPSERAKRIIKTQNAILQQFLQENFDMQPILISRDKCNHILVVTLKEPEQQPLPYGTFFMSAYMLGTDSRDNLTLLPIGKILFRRLRNSTLFIPSLQVINSYKNCGVGTLLLKAVENFAVENGFTELELDSMITAAVLEGVPGDSKANVAESSDSQHPSDEPDQHYYFDRNLYFYACNGFEVAEDADMYIELTEVIPLEKCSLHATDLQYGIAGKKYMYRKTDPEFKIPAEYLKNNDLKESDVHLSKEEYEKSFVPFECKRDEASIQALEGFLEATPISKRYLDS